ncbi:MAG: cytochrome c [Myxococcales bacterium]|nr:cytochrome c [Polyangiaceae bacterium]MDW8249984.1 cytochrome c [Myxococcales bacterium]
MLTTWLVSTGCDRHVTREWTPADHDGFSANSPPRADPAQAQAHLVEVTWHRQCATCHGPAGRGDGPNGPMVQAPDLTQPTWQESVSDAQIAQAILQGKGKMPRFELSPTTVAGLVQRVRAFQRH